MNKDIAQIEPRQPGQIIPASISVYEQIKELAITTLKSKSSHRVYRNTYEHWESYCKDTGHSLVYWDHDNVQMMIDLTGVAYSTKLAMLSHMRRLAKKAVSKFNMQDARFYQIYQTLEGVEFETDETDTGREGIALTIEQFEQFAGVWYDNDFKSRRNRALLWLMYGAGLRRSEVEPLKWSNLSGDILTMRGRKKKGNQTTEQAIVVKRAIRELNQWREYINLLDFKSSHIIPHVDRYGNVHDIGVTGDGVYYIFADTNTLSPLEDENGNHIRVTPHDIRRSIITRMLNGGTPIHVVQNFAGHKKTDTTGLYAKVANAQWIVDHATLEDNL